MSFIHRALTEIKILHWKQRSLKAKLQHIENQGIHFEAGYYGKDEVFIARFPDLTFLDFNWLASNDDGTRQYILPTEIERIADEIIEYGERHGYSIDLTPPSTED